MSDEGRMLAPAEARVRRKVREIAKKDEPKSFIKFQSSHEGLSKSERKRLKDIPSHNRRFKGIVGTKVGGKTQTAAGVVFTYKPAYKEIHVNDMFPIQVGKKQFSGVELHNEIHDDVRHKILPPAKVKDLITKTSKMFPKAETLQGSRITGLRGPKTTPEGDFTIAGTQTFNLEAIRKRLARSGKYGKIAASGLGVAERLIKKKQD